LAFAVESTVAYAVLSVLSGTIHGGVRMLWTIFLVLVVLWMLGVVSSYTLGGFIHVLLVLAIVALLVQLIQGRRVV
jgi:hypothetical protein